MCVSRSSAEEIFKVQDPESKKRHGVDDNAENFIENSVVLLEKEARSDEMRRGRDV